MTISPNPRTRTTLGCAVIALALGLGTAAALPTITTGANTGNAHAGQTSLPRPAHREPAGARTALAGSATNNAMTSPLHQRPNADAAAHMGRKPAP